MLKFVVAAFFILHGLVHLLYCGQCLRLYELQPGMVWPDGSWVFSRLLGDERARLVAVVALVLAASGFVVAGVGLAARQAWWQPVVVAAVLLSAVLFVLFWDGNWQHLDEKGAFALLINGAVFAAVALFRWPNFGF
ncbi:MAG TPA: hypothetical protein VLC95_01435 [Anaerolineae bacterium]|nr:hypothetical protein [Anaerolineae bacterium]